MAVVGPRLRVTRVGAAFGRFFFRRVLLRRSTTVKPGLATCHLPVPIRTHHHYFETSSTASRELEQYSSTA